MNRRRGGGGWRLRRSSKNRRRRRIHGLEFGLDPLFANLLDRELESFGQHGLVDHILLFFDGRDAAPLRIALLPRSSNASSSPAASFNFVVGVHDGLIRRRLIAPFRRPDPRGRCRFRTRRQHRISARSRFPLFPGVVNRVDLGFVLFLDVHHQCFVRRECEIVVLFEAARWNKQHDSSIVNTCQRSKENQTSKEDSRAVLDHTVLVQLGDDGRRPAVVVAVQEFDKSSTRVRQESYIIRKESVHTYTVRRTCATRNARDPG